MSAILFAPEVHDMDNFTLAMSILSQSTIFAWITFFTDALCMHFMNACAAMVDTLAD